LLGSLSHAVCLVQNDNLVFPLGQSHFLLGKHLDPVPHHINTPVIARVQLQHGLFEVLAEKQPGQTEDGGGLPHPGRAGDDDVGDIPVFGEDTESAHSLRVTNNLLERFRPIFLNPRNVAITNTGTGLLH